MRQTTQACTRAAKTQRYVRQPLNNEFEVFGDKMQMHRLNAKMTAKSLSAIHTKNPMVPKINIVHGQVQYTAPMIEK